MPIVESREGDTVHKDHSLVSFEWTIFGLEWLRRSLEEVPVSGWTVDYDGETEPVPDLMRRGIIIGDAWYKVDMGDLSVSLAVIGR